MKPERSDSPKYQQQKQAAVRAAATVFAEKGFHGASTRDIAEQLGIKQASLYYYFDSKEEALEEVCLYGLTHYVKNMDAIAAGDEPFEAKLFAAITNHLTSYREKSEALKVHNDERLYLPEQRRTRLKELGSRYRKELEAIFEEGVATGAVRNTIDCHFAALSLIGLCNGLGEHIVRDPEVDVFEQVRKCTDLIINGTKDEE